MVALGAVLGVVVCWGVIVGAVVAFGLVVVILVVVLTVVGAGVVCGLVVGRSVGGWVGVGVPIVGVGPGIWMRGVRAGGSWSEIRTSEASAAASAGGGEVCDMMTPDVIPLMKH